jgi:hypothetical protein
MRLRNARHQLNDLRLQLGLEPIIDVDNGLSVCVVCVCVCVFAFMCLYVCVSVHVVCHT